MRLRQREGAVSVADTILEYTNIQASMDFWTEPIMGTRTLDYEARVVRDIRYWQIQNKVYILSLYTAISPTSCAPVAVTRTLRTASSRTP